MNNDKLTELAALEAKATPELLEAVKERDAALARAASREKRALGAEKAYRALSAAADKLEARAEAERDAKEAHLCLLADKLACHGHLPCNGNGDCPQTDPEKCTNGTNGDCRLEWAAQEAARRGEGYHG